MYSRHHRKLRIFHLLADALLVWGAFEAAYHTRTGLQLERAFYILTPVKLLLILLSVLSFWGAGMWFGLYDQLVGAGRRRTAEVTFRQSSTAITALIIAEYVLRLDTSRLFLALFTVYACVVLLVFRWNMGPLEAWYRRRFGARHFVWVVGTGDSARRVAALMESSQHYGLCLQGFLDLRPAVQAIQLSGEYPVRELRDLPELFRRHIVDEVLFAVPPEQLPSLEEFFLLCDEEGVRTRVAVDFFPHVHSDIYLDRLGSAPLLTFSGGPSDEVRLLLKRFTDIVLSGFFLLLLGPLMLLIGWLIRLTSPGPALFSQVRCGLNGRRFRLYKFRSMVANAEELQRELADRNERRLVFKMRRDPRLTPLGRWLRKFSIDEWPQLWNVLRGDMSLVGPRPAIPEEVEQYKRWQRRRLRMRPGLTCLWVVEGRDEVDFETWMTLDMQYIDNWSLALDWKIILRTIPQVVTGKGAH